MIGEVGRPGSYSIEGTMELLTAISKAGGVGKFGSSAVDVIREEGAQQLLIRIDLNRVLEGRSPNIEIQPRDTVYVRRRLI